MAKPFEITYSPANWTSPPGGIPNTWITPYGGLHVQAPSSIIGPQFTPAVQNFFFRNATLQTRPAFSQKLPGPDGSNFMLAIGSFLSPNQVWHTFAMTVRGLFQLEAGWQSTVAQGRNPWQYLGGPELNTAPLQWQPFNNILYYSNGIDLSAWDGQANTPITDVAFLGGGTTPASIAITQVAVSGGVATYTYSSYTGTLPFIGMQVIVSGFTMAGNNGTAFITGGTFGSSGTFTVTATTQVNETHAAVAAGYTTVFGGLYIGELDNHLILANVYETTNGSTVVYPNRIRWSNSGFNPSLGGVFGANLGTPGATFDPNVNLNAGLNDFLDVPDLITGIMTIGRTGFLFRQNGITEFAPTGNGNAPFDFNHLWASQNGVGNVYPFSIAQYGNLGIFIAYDNIYEMQGTTVSFIGGGTRDAIMTDLSNATGSPKASIDRGFNLGYTFLSYNLRIPLQNGMRTYVYSIEDGSWTSWFSSGLIPTGIPNECWM